MKRHYLESRSTRTARRSIITRATLKNIRIIALTLEFLLYLDNIRQIVVSQWNIPQNGLTSRPASPWGPVIPDRPMFPAVPRAPVAPAGPSLPGAPCFRTQRKSLGQTPPKTLGCISHEGVLAFCYIYIYIFGSSLCFPSIQNSKCAYWLKTTIHQCDWYFAFSYL